MGERRNRKSFWDTEDDAKHVSGMREHNSWAGKDHHSSHGSGRYHDLSDSRTTSTRESRDHSGWPSWESIEEDPIAPMSRSFKNSYDAKEIDGEKRYHKNISPGFEEMELHDYNHTHEYDRNNYQRYMQKCQSRSQSRTRGRSRSRSSSRGREQERERGWSRSRSRSRSDGYGYASAHRRSRSPIGDYRRQSYGWSDKRSGQEKSSQTCRDYALGGCRKGIQCRFFHPDSISSRDGELVEDDRVESWRGRSDHSQISKNSYTRLGFESRNGVSNLYHGKEEQFLNRSRTASISCREFKIGNCRWGDACRFSHDAASAGSFGQDTRNTTVDKDFDHQQFTKEKPLCRYFAAGRCNRDNCWFSHDDPSLKNLEGWVDKVTESQISHDKSNWRNAPKWDDAMRSPDTQMPTGWGEASAANTSSTGDKWDDATRSSNTRMPTGWCEASAANTTSTGDKWDDATRSSNTRMPTGWGEASAANTTSSGDKWDDATRSSNTRMPTGWGEASAANTISTGDITNGQSDDRWGFKSKHDTKIWGLQEWTSNSLDGDKQPSLPRESGSYGGDIGPAKSFVEDDMPHKQDHQVLHGLQLQNKDGIANLHGLSALRENQSLTIGALQQNVPPAPHIQQQHLGVISNPMSSFGSTVLDEVKDIRYTNHPILLSGQSINQNDTSTFPGHSSVQNESDRGQNMLYTNLSNGLDTDLQLSETHIINPLNVQIRRQNDKKTVESPGALEASVPQFFINLQASKHPDQVSNSLISNVGQQASPVKDPVSLTQSFVNEISQTYAGMGVSNSRGMLSSSSCITDCPPLVNTSNVQDNAHAVSLDQFNSMGNSRENTEPGNLNLAQATDHQNNQMQQSRSSPSSIVGTGVDGAKLKHPESPRQQGEMVATLGVSRDSKSTVEECKGMQEFRLSETLDGQGIVEEGSANKDEKGMRMFKNSLVELVKDILKPTWKVGRMSRDVHKTVVKKVVDKVSSTIQAEHIPKTQDKVELYLSSSKPKITKLVQAYVERSRKPDA